MGINFKQESNLAILSESLSVMKDGKHGGASEESIVKESKYDHRYAFANATQNKDILTPYCEK